MWGRKEWQVLRYLISRYSKPGATQIVWYYHIDIDAKAEQRPESEPHIHIQNIFYKSTEVIHLKMDKLSGYGAGTIEHPYAKKQDKTKLWPLYLLGTQNLKWIADPNIELPK